MDVTAHDNGTGMNRVEFPDIDGATTGAWQKGGGNGYFTTVWQRDPISGKINWVLDHGDDYEWSIVGEPSGRYLWALTRTEKPSPELLRRLEERVKQLGYDWTLVRMTQH